MTRSEVGRGLFVMGLLASASSVHAQTAPVPAPVGAGQNGAASAPPGDGLSDIIVTATRRAEVLQNVPIAVTAYQADSLLALSTRTVGDLAATTPNLARTSGPSGGNDAFFFIRGIGQVDSNPANDPGVGVYIDGVYLGRLQGASLDTSDIARVEVLRGPQGTLFGRNTIGGAINITSIDPGSDFGFTGRLTGGSREHLDAFGALNLPFSNTFSVRLSAASRNQHGWGTNVYTGKHFGNIQDIAGRLKAVWKPSNDFKLTLSADGVRARDGTPQTILTGVNYNAGVIPGTTPTGVPLPTDLLADTSPNVDRSYASIDPKNETDNYGGSATLDYNASDALEVKAILAYRHVRQLANNDFDATGYRLYDNFFNTRSNGYSAELQLIGHALDNKLNYILGGYAYKEDIYNDNAICLGTNLGAPFGPFGPQRNQGGCLRNNQQFNLGIHNYAGFGNLTYNLTDKLGIVLGGRFTYERKRQSFDFFIDNTAGVFSFFGFPPIIIPTLSPRNPGVGVPTTYEKSWKEFTPKAGINYQANADLLLYASYSRGFKSGGFNGRPTANASGGFNLILPYDPEHLDSYEIGFKSELFHRHLRLNAAVYHSIYDGIQLLVLDAATGFFNNANAGRNHINGFEIEATVKPSHDFELYANVGYTHTDYVYLDPRAGIPADSPLPVTPKWTLGLGASYTIHTGVGSIAPRADYNYRSAVQYGAANAPLEHQAGYGLLNLRVTWTDRSDRFSLAAFGLNVTNVRYWSNAQDVRGPLGVAFAQIGAPAEWGVEAGFKF